MLKMINAPSFGLQHVDNALDTAVWQRCNAAFFGSVATHPLVGDSALLMRVDCVGPALIMVPRRGAPALTAIWKIRVSTGPYTYLQSMKRMKKQAKDK